VIFLLIKKLAEASNKAGPQRRARKRRVTRIVPTALRAVGTRQSTSTPATRAASYRRIINKMSKPTINIIGTVLLFLLVAFFLYPEPIEIILMLIVGLCILHLFGMGLKRLDKKQESKENKHTKITERVLQTLFIVYVISFLTIFCVSWFEKRIVWNIFQTKRGKMYIAIDLSILIIFLIYCGIFYLRYRRWPNSKDFRI
jgi:small-conductance mechanosensitive channel